MIEVIMNTVTANELKTKGISAVEARLQVDEEVIISVRGKDKYVVMDLEKYAKLREYELAIALQEARADVDAGRYSIGSVSDHMLQVTDEL
jgi:PHD/YefM family antitoxin component YafN of YafNO toxin-antitoxin module